MTESIKWRPEINAGNVVSWFVMIVGLVASYVNTQRDIKDLSSEADRTKVRIERVEAKAEALKDDFGDMKADIRVIRQILENGSSRAK